MFDNHKIQREKGYFLTKNEMAIVKMVGNSKATFSFVHTCFYFVTSKAFRSNRFN